MTVDARNVINDMRYLNHIVKSVDFRFAGRNMKQITIIPKIDDACEPIKECLGKYNVPDIQDGYKCIYFMCNSNSAVYALMQMIVEYQKLTIKAAQRDILAEKINGLANQLPHVKSSLFSRGVKSFRNSVKLLSKVVLTQNKGLGR